jgi:hypothetical protein
MIRRLPWRPAERSDIVYVGPVVDAVSFSLSNNQIKFNSTSGTNWQQLGLYRCRNGSSFTGLYLNWLVASEQETWRLNLSTGRN